MGLTILVWNICYFFLQNKHCHVNVYLFYTYTLVVGAFVFVESGRFHLEFALGSLGIENYWNLKSYEMFRSFSFNIWMKEFLNWYYHYYLTSYGFYTLAITVGLLLKPEWQQVTSGLLDSSQFFKNVFPIILIFPLILIYTNPFSTPFNYVRNKWYHRHCPCSIVFSHSGKIEIFFCSTFFYFR